jgi:hypothetical protein
MGCGGCVQKLVLIALHSWEITSFDLRIPTAIGVSLCIAVVCCCLLRIPTAIGMWLINLFPLSVCGLDGSVALTHSMSWNGEISCLSDHWIIYRYKKSY